MNSKNSFTPLSGSVTFVSYLPAKPVSAIASRSATSKSTQKQQLPAAHPTLPPRPDFPQFGGGNSPTKRHSDVFSAGTARHAEDDSDQERPRKTRRLSSPIRAPLAAIPTSGRSWKDGARTNTSRGQENRVVHLDRQERSNGKRRENAPTSTPANTSASKQLTDYSAFKGRGRYGKTSCVVLALFLLYQVNKQLFQRERHDQRDICHRPRAKRGNGFPV